MNKEDKIKLLEKISKDTLMEHLDIKYFDAGEDFLCAEMLVRSQVRQPYGFLHGGATAALAESVGSAFSMFHLLGSEKIPLGIELHTSHLRSVSSGKIFARAEFYSITPSNHFIDIRITDENKNLISVSRLVTAIVKKKN